MSSFQDERESDIWSYIWGSAFFSSSKAYKHLTGHRVVHSSFNWLWKSSCQNKHKVFFWLLLNDRLSTRELLRRRSMELPSYLCVCCNRSVEESLSHLFLHCPFAQSCWNSIGLLIGRSDPYSSLENLRTQLGVPFFMEIIILMSWCIWMQRNDFIFKGLLPSQEQCRNHFVKEFALVILRAKTIVKQ